MLKPAERLRSAIALHTWLWLQSPEPMIPMREVFRQTDSPMYMFRSKDVLAQSLSGKTTKETRTTATRDTVQAVRSV
jgi:hypothetical protein